MSITPPPPPPTTTQFTKETAICMELAVLAVKLSKDIQNKPTGIEIEFVQTF